MKKKLTLLISCASNKIHTIEYIEDVLRRINIKSKILVSDKNNQSIIKNFNYNFFLLY